MHLHYQRVVDLSVKDEHAGAAYNLKANTNVSRNVQRLDPSGNRQVCLAQGVCSIFTELTALVFVSLIPLAWSVLLGYLHALGLILVDLEHHDHLKLTELHVSLT